MRNKLLYKLQNHPHTKIESNGRKLIITFQDGISSYSKWHTVEIKYSTEDNQHVLIEKNEE